MNITITMVLDQTPQGGHRFQYERYNQLSWHGIRILRDGAIIAVYSGKEKYIDNLWKEKTKGAVSETTTKDELWTIINNLHYLADQQANFIRQISYQVQASQAEFKRIEEKMTELQKKIKVF